MNLPKAFINHPAIQEVEFSQDSDYKYEVFLKENYRFTNGRMADCRTGFFYSVEKFNRAKPMEIKS